MTTHPERTSVAEQSLKGILRWIPECHGQAIEKMAKDFKARMTVRLAVAGAFHTHFMKPAEEKLRSANPSNCIHALIVGGSLHGNVLMLLFRFELVHSW